MKTKHTLPRLTDPKNSKLVAAALLQAMAHEKRSLEHREALTPAELRRLITLRYFAAEFDLNSRN